jgi:hypothetical protein
MPTEKLNERHTKRSPPTPEQVRAQQIADAEKAHAEAQAKLPAKMPNTAVAVPDNRNGVQRYLDEIAPASIVGRLIKFGKDGKFITNDDGEPIGDDVDFIALCDQTLIGYVKFNDEGAPPDRHMGLLYDGFVMPDRTSLGENDQSKWEIGLDGKPADPYQHHVYLVLQRGDTTELFTYAASSLTSRRAVGNLLRHYDRLQKTHNDMFPVIRLKTGGFQHRDERVGWVHVPVFAVVGRAPKDSAAKPDSSPSADFQDEIPY